MVSVLADLRERIRGFGRGNNEENGVVVWKKDNW